MLRNDPAYADKAARVSALARDITEYLATLDLQDARRAEPLTVAYHAACSLQHGQKVMREPKDLLSKVRLCGQRRAGRSFVLRFGRHLQHSSAGAGGKVACAQDRQYRRLKPDVIAAGNIGCITQTRRRHRRPGRAYGRIDRLGDRRPGSRAACRTRPAQGFRDRCRAPTAHTGCS